MKNSARTLTLANLHAGKEYKKDEGAERGRSIKERVLQGDWNEKKLVPRD